MRGKPSLGHSGPLGTPESGVSDPRAGARVLGQHCWPNTVLAGPTWPNTVGPALQTLKFRVTLVPRVIDSVAEHCLGG